MKFDLDKVRFYRWEGGVTLTLKMRIAEGWDTGNWDDLRKFDEKPQDNIDISITDSKVSISFNEDK